MQKSILSSIRKYTDDLGIYIEKKKKEKWTWEKIRSTVLRAPWNKDFFVQS